MPVPAATIAFPHPGAALITLSGQPDLAVLGELHVVLARARPRATGTSSGASSRARPGEQVRR